MEENTARKLFDIIQEYHMHPRMLKSPTNRERMEVIEATTGMWADARQRLLEAGLCVGDGSHMMEKGYPASVLLAAPPGVNPKAFFAQVATQYNFGPLYESGMAYMGMNEAPKGYARITLTARTKPGRDFSRLGPAGIQTPK